MPRTYPRLRSDFAHLTFLSTSWHKKEKITLKSNLVGVGRRDIAASGTTIMM